MSFKEFLNESLSSKDKKAILDDFKEWSGGYTPDEAEDTVDDYIESSLPGKFNAKDAEKYLKSF